MSPIFTQPQTKTSFPLLILIIFIMSIIIPINSQCTNCIQLSNCYICYNNCSNPQNNSSFISCAQTQCTEYQGNACKKQITAPIKQKQCLMKCCGLNINYFSIRQLNICQDNIGNNGTLKTIVLLIVVMAVCLLVMFVAYCIFCRNGSGGVCCRCFKSHRNYANNSNPNSRTAAATAKKLQNPIQQIPKNPPNQQQKLSWKHDYSINQTIQDTQTICTICLNNTINCMTICKHYFHINCLSQWLNRNPHCPICRNKQIMFIKYYCVICSYHYLQIDLRIFKNLKIVKLPICQKCS